MKKILTILILLQLVYSASNAQIKLIGNITTNGKASYPTHIDSLGKGGMMVMPTVGSRDSIPSLRRKFGMLVYVQENDSLYKLKNTASAKKYTDNSDWVTIGLNSTADVDRFLKYLKTSDSLFIIGNTTIDSSLLVKGKVYVNDSLVANSRVYALGKVQLDSTLFVNRVATLNDSLNVKGKVQLDSTLTVNKVTTLRDSVNVKGKVQLDSTLTVNKVTTLRDSLNVKSRTQLDSTLFVNKVTTLNDSLYVKGKVMLDSSLYVKGKTTITDSILAKANVVIDSNLYVKGGLRLGGKLQLDSGLVFNDSLTVTRGARIDSSLLVKGRIYVNDSLVAIGNTLIKGKVQIDSNFYVKGTSTFDKHILVNTITIGNGSNYDGRNTGVGYQILQAATTGYWNDAFGNNSMYNLTNGAFNSSFGGRSMYTNVSGNGNASFGYQSLYNNLADSNAAFGYNAGYKNTTGSNNTFIGKAADADSVNLSNATAIGAGAIVKNSNTLQLGNTSLSLVNTSGSINSSRTVYAKNLFAYDTLIVKGNYSKIDSNLIIGKDLYVGGKLTVGSGLEFKDSLVVTRGARIDSSLLVKGKINLNDSLIVKGNATISGNLTVKGIDILSKLTTDSTTLLTRLIDSSGTLNDRINLKVNFADTSGMLSNRLKISDTLTMLNNLVRKSDTATMLSNRLKISDTLTMLSNRLKISDTNTMLSNRLKISDTSTMLSNRIGKDTLNLSSRIGINRQAIIDSSNYLNDRINLKINIVDTSGMLANRLKISDTSTMVSNLLRKTDTAQMLSNMLKISDTTTMLSNRLKISDTTTMLSNRLKISDTLTMLSNRIGRDTLNLSSRIDNLSSATSTGKLSVTDTAAMLATYARKFTKNFMVKLGSQSIGSISVPKTLGKYKSGDSVLAKGKTLDELFLDISTEKVSPTYRMPTVTLNATPSGGNIEIGSTLNVTFTNTPTINQGGALGTVTYKRDATSLGAGIDNVPNVTSNITYTVEVAYGHAPVLPNNLGENDSTGIFAAGTATSQSVIFTPKAKRYWGASNNAVITDADLTGTTTTDFNSNASNSPLNIETINVTGSQYIFFAYPAPSSFIVKTIDVGGFTSTDAFTQTTRNVVNASGHTQSYVIWVSKNSFSGNISKFYINFYQP